MPTITELRGQKNIGKALADARNMGLLMFGLGAGMRGLGGLINLGKRTMAPSEPAIIQPKPIQVYADEDEEKTANWLTEPFERAFRGEGSTPYTWPLAWPLQLGLGTAGLYGGYKATDLILDANRKAKLKSDLERAKKEYEEALRGQHKISEDLDHLYDLAMETHGEKQAFIGTDTAGYTLGTLLGIGVPLAAISGKVMYDITKSKQPAKIMEEAKRRRARELWERQPLPVYVQLRHGGKRAPDQEELAGEPLDKTSADTPNPPPAIPVKSEEATTPETPDINANGQENPLPIGSDSNHPGRTK